MKTNATTPIPQGYKSTPLGIIPQEWEVERFRDVGHFLRNNTLSRDKMSESDGCVQNIHYGDVLIKYREILDVSRTNIPWIVENSKDSPLGDMLQDGDIVISDTAEDYAVGKATELLGINGASVVAGLHTMPFRPLSNLFSPCFLGYYINSMAYRFQLYALIQGIKVCAISKKTMSGTFLIVPPLAEQKKIAEVLGVWDKAIEKQSQLIEQLTLRKRGLMQQLLTAKRRLPGFSNPWEEIRLKEILIEGSKIPVDSISRYKKISIGLYKKGISYIDDNKVKADIRPFYVREKGEIIIGKQNYFNGSIAIVNDKFDGTICSNAIMSFRVNDSFHLKFIYEAISQPDYLRKREMMANGTGQKELSEKDFLNFEIIVPSIEEQTAIAEVLTAADREIELAQQKLELLRQQKRGLMQQLLTGKKRVKV